MSYSFDNSIPIYLQIMNIIQLEIISKKLLPGQKLSSIREYSEKFNVNPNTVQKALLNLENNGLIYTERTNGKFITKDIKIIDSIRKKIAKEKIDKFLDDMTKIGYDFNKIKNLINKEEESLNGTFKWK